MADILTDAFKLGLGAIDMAKDETNAAINHLQKNYKKETAEGRKELKRLLTKTKENADSAHRKIKTEVKSAFKNQDFVKEKDLNELRSTVEKLGKTTHRIVTGAAEKVKTKVEAKMKSGKASAKKSAKKSSSKAKKKR
jgi:polyhydroxyalkanoate synthesis regulator phasin